MSQDRTATPQDDTTYFFKNSLLWQSMSPEDKIKYEEKVTLLLIVNELKRINTVLDKQFMLEELRRAALRKASK